MPTVPQMIVDALVRGESVRQVLHDAALADTPGMRQGWVKDFCLGKGEGGSAWSMSRPASTHVLDAARSQSGAVPDTPVCLKMTGRDEQDCYSSTRDATQSSQLRATSDNVRAEASVVELIITSLLSQLYTCGASPHFLVAVHAFPRGDDMCTALERVGRVVLYKAKRAHRLRRRVVARMTQLDRIVPTLKPDGRVLCELIFTVLFVLSQMQHAFGIIHHDLQMENVWLKTIGTEDDGRACQFGGRDLRTIKWFAYRPTPRHDEQQLTFWLPNRGYLVKIGDLGNAIATRVPVMEYDDTDDDEVRGEPDEERGEPEANAATATSMEDEDAATTTVSSSQPSAATTEPLIRWATRSVTHGILADPKSEQGRDWKRDCGITEQFKPGYDAHFWLPQLRELCRRHWRIPEPPELVHLLNMYQLRVSRRTERPPPYGEGQLEASPRALILDNVDTCWRHLTQAPDGLTLESPDVLAVDDLYHFDARVCLLPAQ